MMRICTKCGDYYADASLAFCLLDGAPLINVSPERWSEGTRVVEGKENALKVQKRKLKWRRAVVSTMAMATLAVAVMAFNSFISIETTRPENVVALPSTLPTNSTAAITPTPVYKISGRVTTDGSKALGGVKITLGGAKTETTTTDADGNYAFKKLPAGGNYTITPASAKIKFMPPSLPINQIAQDRSANFVGTVQSECSEAEESSLIIKSCSATWRDNISGDETEIIKEYFPVGVVKARARARAILSEKIGYRITFSKPCQAGVVTASYTWQVTAPQIRTEPQPKQKRLRFAKAGETWRCIAN